MIVLRIDDIKKNRDAPMPYVMLLTRLYKYILQTNPQSIVPFNRFTYHQRVMNPLDIPRKTIKNKGKRAAPPSSSSSSSSNEDEEPSFLQFYEELSNDEDLTDAQRDKRGISCRMSEHLQEYFQRNSILKRKVGELVIEKQDCTSVSIVEAEYVSLSASCAQVLWKITQLMDYGFHFDKILIYCDSKSATAISCNPIKHSRTKHIPVLYHFVKEHVKKDTIELYFVKTD
ncbi:hypothetical protein Tco_0359873 [Tanacetum coccineum]